MGLSKLAVVSIAALLPLAPYVSAQTQTSISKDLIDSVHQVSEDETLWRIATNNSLEGVSIWQLLISIYRLNPHAFVDNHISRIKPYSQLLLPNLTQITHLDSAQSEAAVEQLLAGNTVPELTIQVNGLAQAAESQGQRVHHVQDGETLWRIATNNTLEGVSVWQTLMSLYHLNLHAFLEKDIARLRTDSKLVMPTLDQATSLSPQMAELTYERMLAASVASMEVMTTKVQEPEVPIALAEETIAEQISAQVAAKVAQQIATSVAEQIAANVAASVAEQIAAKVAANVAAQISANVAEQIAAILSEQKPVDAKVSDKDQETAITTGTAAVQIINNAAADKDTAGKATAGEAGTNIANNLAKKVDKVVAKEMADTAVEKSATAPAKAPFILKKVTIIGNESFTDEILHSLVAGAEGTEQNLAQLGQLAARITQFYQDQGYSIVRAILPAQTVRQGTVTIQVIEAKYGAVNLTNDSGVSDELMAKITEPMQPDTVISDANMYSSLLHLSDVPGLLVNSSLSPGAKVGTSDVTLVVNDGLPYSGSLLLDQYGDAYTGTERLTGSVAINNLLGHGDVLSVSGMMSSGDMRFGRLGYDWLLNGKGTHIGAAFSGLNYRLGKDMASSQANGTTRTGSLWVKQPLLRSLDTNVSVQLQYDINQLKDHIDSASLRTDRTIPSLSLTATGDHKNAYKRGGITSWSLGLKSGNLKFDDSAAETSDASAAITRGKFEKINLNISHLQSLSGKGSVFLNAAGQWASENLDSSDKLSTGGANAVRAYGSGAVSGDVGYVSSAEFRYYLAQAFDGGLTGSLFYDRASVMVNKTPWSAAGDENSATISGAGIALNWAGPDQMSAGLMVATPLSPTSALVDKHPDHTVWMNISKGF